MLRMWALVHQLILTRLEISCSLNIDTIAFKHLVYATSSLIRPSNIRIIQL